LENNSILKYVVILFTLLYIYVTRAQLMERLYVLVRIWIVDSAQKHSSSSAESLARGLVIASLSCIVDMMMMMMIVIIFIIIFFLPSVP